MSEIWRESNKIALGTSSASVSTILSIYRYIRSTFNLTTLAGMVDGIHDSERRRQPPPRRRGPEGESEWLREGEGSAKRRVLGCVNSLPCSAWL